MMKKIVSLLFAVVLFGCLPLIAYAVDVPQERNDCTIELLVRYDGSNITGGTLTAIKVGNIAESDGSYFFTRVLDSVLLEDVQSPEAASSLYEFYSTNRNGYDFYEQTVAVSDGRAVFTDLSAGLYLIVQRQAAEGYSKLSPFVIGVPYMNDGEYQYYVKAAIKSELEREPEPEPTSPPPAEPDGKLPQTGQLNWPVPLMAVSGLALFALGWYLCFGKKKETYEK